MRFYLRVQLKEWQTVLSALQSTGARVTGCAACAQGRRCGNSKFGIRDSKFAICKNALFLTRRGDRMPKCGVMHIV